MRLLHVHFFNMLIHVLILTLSETCLLSKLALCVKASLLCLDLDKTIYNAACIHLF